MDKIIIHYLRNDNLTEAVILVKHRLIGSIQV